jgi:phospholipid/cholesterol/gamma-HCH transport system substrate-binding protein
MDERVIKFRVGVMVVATLFIAGILVLLFGNTPSLVRNDYIIYMHFDDAPGVTEGTPIRKSGILIGRVRSVRFAEQGGVIVEGEIHHDIKLFHNEVPQVSGSLLGGDVVIQFLRTSPSLPVQPAAPAAEAAMRAREDGDTVLTAAQEGGQPGQLPGPDQEIKPGDYIEGTVAPSPFQVLSGMQGDLNEAIKALSNAGTEVSKLAANVNKVLESNDDQINRIIAETETAISTFQTAMNNINDVIGDPKVRENLKQMADNLPQLFEDSRSTVNSMRTTLEGVDRNMRNLEGFTAPLGERGEDIIARIDRTTSSLDELLGIMSDFGRKLNSGQGSFGKFMTDPELYNSLVASAKNVECVSRELKPIISDVRIFTDRIARDPGVLGVRGALQRNPGTKWPAVSSQDPQLR